MTNTMKRPGQVAEKLKVSGMTLRNYVKAFEPFLSDYATRPTGRRFTAEDVQTLKHASSLLREGLTYNDVRNQLDQEKTTGVILEDEYTEPEPEPEPETEPETPPTEDNQRSSSIQTIDFFTNVVEHLKEEHATTTKAQDEFIQELKTDKAELKADNEYKDQLINYERQPFFRKWFTPQPERTPPPTSETDETQPNHPT